MKGANRAIDSGYRSRGSGSLFQRFSVSLLVAALASCTGVKGVEQPVMWSEPVIKDNVSCVTGLVPARDGTRLYTEVYRLVEANEKRPVIIARSPCARQYGEGCFRTGMNPFPKEGYVAIYQSVRGTGHSEGEFTPLFNDENDGADLISWAARQPWSNGKVGMTHGSYLGATQWLAAIATPPHLVVITPSITPIDYRDTWKTRVAHNTILHDANHPSYLTIPVVQGVSKGVLNEPHCRGRVTARLVPRLEHRCRHYSFAGCCEWPDVQHVLAVCARMVPLALALCTSVTANPLISRWFVRRLGLALGLSSFGIGMAGVLLPPIVAAVLPGFGWRVIWRVGGLLVALIVMPLVVFVIRDKPSELDGVHYITAGRSASHHHGHAAQAGGLTWREVVARKNFWLLVCIYLPIMAANGGVGQNLAPYATHHGLSQQTAGSRC